MAKTLNLDAESGANIIDDDASPSLSIENSVGPALEVKGKSVGNASIAGLRLSNNSVASSAVLTLGDTAFVSVTTIKFTTGAVVGTGVIRVVLTDGTFGWIPVLPAGTVTAAVVE